MNETEETVPMEKEEEEGNNRIDDTINSVVDMCRSTYPDPSPPPMEVPEEKCTSPRRFSRSPKLRTKADAQKNARGARICQLYREHPQLMRSAQSRSVRNNQERRQIWSEIAEQINMEFPDLKQVTVLEAKKLVDYYKGKQISSPSASPSPDEEPYFSSFLEKTIPDSSPMEFDKHLDLGRRKRFEFLTKFTTDCMKVYEETHDPRSRNQEANAGRDKLWREITEATNWKFREWEGLGEVCKDQVRKTHSNFKRRNQERLDRISRSIRGASVKIMHPATPSSMSESSMTSESSGSPEASDHQELSLEPMELPEVQINPAQRDEEEFVELQNAQLQMPLTQEQTEQTAKMQEDLDFYKRYFLYSEIIKISSAIARTDFQ